MRVETNRNLTVDLLRDHLFGPGRFDPAAPGAVVHSGQVHAADRARLAPPIEAGRRACDPCPVEQPWPFDTPMPTGLPRLEEHAGLRATDVPGGFADGRPIPKSDVAVLYNVFSNGALGVSRITLESSDQPLSGGIIDLLA